MYRSLYLTPEQLCQLQERTDQFVEGCQTGWDLIEAVLSATAELSDVGLPSLGMEIAT